MVEDTNEKFRLATEALVAARQEVSEAERKKATADAQLARESQVKTQAEQKVKDAQQELENADKQVQPATDALKAAELQAQQAKTDEEIQKVKEAKATADAQLEQASQAKTQAEQQLQQAIQAKTEADEKVKQTTQALAAAAEQLQHASQILDGAKDQLRQAARAKVTAEQQDVLERLRGEVKDARELLEFAVSEGYSLPETTVQSLKKAEEFLLRPDVPSWQERAEFESAYCDLARLLSPITVEILKKPESLTSWLKERGKILGGLVVVLFVIPLWLGYKVCHYLNNSRDCKICPEWTLLGLTFAVVGLSAAAFLAWGLYVFTGVVTKEKLLHLIRFCYVFIGLFLAFSVLPFVVIPFLPGLYSVMIQSPIGVVQGCSIERSADGSKLPVPEELKCKAEKNTYQWVINIGGIPYEPGTLMTPVSNLQPDGSSGKNVQLQKVNAEISSPQAHQKKACQDKGILWSPLSIQGGLVVPLYVVVLALIGGIVSMTRRVPEYQRRALDAKESLTNGKAREFLVFQIMQVLSAPLIAVTVYYLFQPDTVAKSVLLGFASGFASEPILLAIRALVEKLTPESSLSKDSLGKLIDDFKARSPEEKKVLAAALKTSDQGAAQPQPSPGAANQANG